MRKLPFALLLLQLLPGTQSEATPIAFDFNIVASEGTVTGTFEGEDANMDNFLMANELTFFEATASGTTFTGGPFTITDDEATFLAFNFSIPTMDLLRLVVTNGSLSFSTYEAIECDPCSPGSYLGVSLGHPGDVLYTSYRPIVSETVTPTAVPEPSSLTLLGLGLGSIGVRRWRQRKRV